MQKNVRRIEFRLTSLVLVIILLGLIIFSTILPTNNITKLSKEQETGEISLLREYRFRRLLLRGRHYKGMQAKLFLRRETALLRKGYSVCL